MELHHDYFVARVLDVVAVKGKTRPVKIYELVGFRKLIGLDVQQAILVYERAFESLCRRDFDVAINGFRDYLVIVPEDKASLIHIATCKRLQLEAKFESEWTYFIALEEK
jgi:adenylate cyclase